jgi:hypothetical protein
MVAGRNGKYPYRERVEKRIWPLTTSKVWDNEKDKIST